MEALRQQTRSVRSGLTAISKALLVAQVALSFVLVAGAFLLGQTLNRLHTVDVGYGRDHVLTMMLFPQPGRRSIPNSLTYYQQLANEMIRLPGVESVSYSSNGPANEFEDLQEVYSSLSMAPVHAAADFVGPDFFHVVGMHLLRGREFSWRDEGGGPRPAIISQSLAEKLFRHSDAIGRTVYLGPRAHADRMSIVGVVNSASLWKVESVRPYAIYRLLAADFANDEPLMNIRTTVDPRSLKAVAERTVRSLGHQYSLRTMSLDERLDSYLSVQRLTALLGVFFGVVALVIASIGVYGLMSFHVTRRTAELGVRFALGAQRIQVLSMVLREVLSLATLGCMFGLMANLWTGSLIRRVLFDVSATDPTILASAAFILVAVAALAGSIPAAKAASVDPLTALRNE
jgi:predicted permease